MTLKTDIDLLAADAALMHDIIHGGTSDTVTTDGGTVPSVAKAINDAVNAIESGQVADGSAAAPSIAFANDTDTGIYRIGANNLGVAVGGAKALDISTSGLSFSAVDLSTSAIDKTVASLVIVDTFLYDTSKDSDGGAWRKRCAHTSWENETLSGNWLGSAANETAARAISGATTGSYYYDTTAAGFYTLNAGSGKTATYRGNVRQFPAQVLITVEAARVILWDLTQANVPMWMVFSGFSNTGSMAMYNAASCVSALNGQMAIGDSTYDLRIVNFVSDSASRYLNSAVGGKYPASISSRNANYGFSAGLLPAIVNRVCYDVAMTVLPNAPVDVATGLPVPTIAAATDGNATYSTSVIKDDGTVVNIASDSTGTAVGVEFDGLALKVIRSDGNVYYWNDVRALTTGASPSATVSASTTPAALGTASKQAKRALSSSTGVTLMRRNQLTLASSMLAYITKDYTSGWLVGNVMGAWLADTVAETITGTELVTNGTFATDTNWEKGAGVTISGGVAAFSGVGANLDSLYQNVGAAIGKSYLVTFTVSGFVSGGVYPCFGADVGQVVTANGTYRQFILDQYGNPFIIFKASSAGTTLNIDDVSVVRAEADRSVKAKGMQVFGSITKAAVASGARLVGYSGFSAANYLEQPYNSDLDFGTGDFCVMGWAKFAATAAKEVIFCRDSPTTGKLIRLQVDVTTSYLSASAYDGTTTRTATGAAAIDDATWKHVLLTYSSGTLTIYVNGVSYANATGAALLTLNNATAVLDIGVDSQHANPATNGTLALWRSSATAPSAEQIKHIYETEKTLFDANSYCCLAGTSNAVTALAYDEDTDLLHVGTSYGRSTFKGLARTSSEATAIGAFTALSASQGIIAQGGATAVDVYVPAYSLREELQRDAEQMAKFGQNLVAHDFTATASQTTFTLPVGWEIVAVYQQGSLKRETTSWTRSFDGFKWSAVLGTGATVSDWISILAKRV